MTVTNKDLAHVFKCAKKRLSTTYVTEVYGKSDRFICIAIKLASDHNEITGLECEVAKELIAKRLEGYQTFEQWLVKNSEVTWGQIEAGAGRKMQETRQAWLDSLIEEFSNKD